MALLYCPRFQAFDLNGDPISGAQLWTYDSVATTTPKLTYTDAARTVAHANPVVADAYGVFPQIFGEEGSGYYCVLQDAEDETIDEFLAVQMLGQDASSVFLRDFALNGRLKGYGEAGVVNLEFMPAEGTETGGSGRIGGADGTQGDDLEIDFAEETHTGNMTIQGNLTLEGELTFGTGSLVPVRTTSGVESAVASVDVALSDAFTAWEIRITNLKFSAAAHLRLLFSFDNDATYKTGATDYLHEGLYQGNAASVNNGVSTAAYMQITAAVAAATATGGALDATIRITSQASRETRALCQFAHFSPGTNADCLSGTWAGQTNNTGFGKASHVRILPSAGTITFDYAVIGLP